MSNPKETTPGAAELWNVIREHGTTEIVSVTHTRLLAKLAAEHYAACVESCTNGEDANTDDLESRIYGLAIALGCKDVEFSYDPRGCTVRLIFADRFGNTIAGGYGVGTDANAT